MLRVSLQHMDVRAPSLSPPIDNHSSPCSFCADHTKYIGKSSGHQHDVKFSEDGESVLEGEDIE